MSLYLGNDREFGIGGGLDGRYLVMEGRKPNKGRRAELVGTGLVELCPVELG